MRINENNYVDKAEKVIKELAEESKQRKSRYGYDFQTPKPSGDDSRYL